MTGPRPPRLVRGRYASITAALALAAMSAATAHSAPLAPTAVDSPRGAVVLVASGNVPAPRLPRPRPAPAGEAEAAAAAPAEAPASEVAPTAESATAEAVPTEAAPPVAEAEDAPAAEVPQTAEAEAQQPEAAALVPVSADAAAIEAASIEATAPEASASAGPAPDAGETSAPAEAIGTAADADTLALFALRPRPGNDTPSDGESSENPPSSDDSASAEPSGPTVPLPRARPELSQAEMARLLAVQFYGFQPDFVLKAALDAYRDGHYVEARSIAGTHKDPVAPALLDWLVARKPDSGMSASKVIEILQSHRGWPQPEQLQLRAEQAFHAIGPDNAAVLTFYGQAEPLTIGGRMAFAAALREAGRTAEATAIARELWRDWSLSSGQAASLLTRFGAVLTTEDHLYRFRRLVLRRRGEEAVAQAQLLGDGYAGLARSVIAVLNQQDDARKLLAGVAPKFLSDPLYVFARVQRLRRAGQPIEAARFLLGSQLDMDLSGDGDIWWEERQKLSRELLDTGTPDLAYQVVAGAKPEGEGDQVAAAFHAGWYALRFMHDASRAEEHFRQLHVLATLPRTKARASYWLGRTHEAEGREDAARLDYEEAARFGGTFYGQLARQRLGVTTTGLERMPRPSAIDRIRFANRDLVKVVRMLAAAGYSELSLPFLEDLGESVDTPGEVALLSTLARRIGRTHAAIAAAAAAEERGLKVASLPALFYGVPAELRTPDRVDRAVVYAVVRQESAFNHAAVSHAGARGLMQLMPATARATARQAQIPYSEQRLVTDPLYNATLGAHHLGELLGGLRNSYILTFAGYNAGPGRALEWVRAYGDPRGGATDPVDWIERIPFGETRDYVQKVMENLQLYRSRTGHPLSISQDLQRGGPQG